MDLIEKKSIQKSLIVFINIESFKKGEDLLNDYEEFESLVKSSDVEIAGSLKFKQNAPVTSSFISIGKLEQIKELSIQNKF